MAQTRQLGPVIGEFSTSPGKVLTSKLLMIGFIVAACIVLALIVVFWNNINIGLIIGAAVAIFSLLSGAFVYYPSALAKTIVVHEHGFKIGSSNEESIFWDTSWINFLVGPESFDLVIGPSKPGMMSGGVNEHDLTSFDEPDKLRHVMLDTAYKTLNPIWESGDNPWQGGYFEVRRDGFFCHKSDMTVAWDELTGIGCDEMLTAHLETQSGKNIPTNVTLSLVPYSDLITRFAAEHQK